MITIAAMMSWPAQSMAGERATRRRPVVSKPATSGPVIVEPARPRPISGLPNSPHFIVESNEVSFGEVIPGLEVGIPNAVVVRVFSRTEWSLRLVPLSLLTVQGRPELISLSRLQWRSSRGGAFVPFRESAPVRVASGKPTGDAGEVVTIDLRLLLGDEDPLGRYGCDFRVEIDSAL